MTARVSIHAFQMQYSSCNKYSLQRRRRSSSSSSNSSSSNSYWRPSFSPLFLDIRNDINENNNSNKKTPPPPPNNNNNKATLTKDTTWRLRFALNGVPTRKGRKVGELLNVDVQFLQEDGYEPPQGQLKQITSNQQQSDATYLKIRSGRWQLSEDPEDRKDGLWIWGLFEEPLYPFLLLQIETEEYVIPGSWGGSGSSGSGKDADVIEPLTLYAQINHRRDKKTGQVELDSAPLNLREFESVKADPFGAAKVDIYQEIKCGQVSLRPLFLSESSLSSSSSSSSTSSSLSSSPSSSSSNKDNTTTANRNATL